eukprot:1040731-Rhodomonas_salina.2
MASGFATANSTHRGTLGNYRGGSGMVDGSRMAGGMLSVGQLTAGCGNDDTIRMTDERSDGEGGTRTEADSFEWFSQWDQLEQWLCKGPGCDSTQYMCPITMEEYSFCSKRCAEYYKRTYRLGNGKKTRWQMRPDAKWCRTCGVIPACDDFECC